MKRIVFLLLAGAVFLTSCVTSYPAKYDVFLISLDLPVMFNDWAVTADRTLRAEVMDTHTEAHVTAMGESNVQSPTGETYRVYETGTRQLSSYTASIDAPLDYQLESRLEPADVALYVRQIQLTNYTLFFMGVASIETSLSIDVDAVARGQQ